MTGKWEKDKKWFSYWKVMERREWGTWKAMVVSVSRVFTIGSEEEGREKGSHGCYVWYELRVDMGDVVRQKMKEGDGFGL